MGISGESGRYRQIHTASVENVLERQVSFEVLSNGDRNRALYAVPSDEEVALGSEVRIWVEPLAKTVHIATPELAVMDEYAREHLDEQ